MHILRMLQLYMMEKKRKPYAKLDANYQYLSNAYNRLIHEYHAALDREERIKEENMLYSKFIKHLVRIRKPNRTV